MPASGHASRSRREDLSVDLPGYEVLGELGRGAGSVVYRVRKNGQCYALKLIEHQVRDDSDEMVAFRREAALLACVDHPQLPRVHEIGEVAGRPYLVIDLIIGHSLSSLTATRCLDEAAALTIAIDLAGALSAAHRVGLVHRDVKPDNVLVNPAGRAWLVDFGLATARQAGADDRVIGTPVYSSPEQTGLLKRPIDGRSDLYSLGAVLYECVTGEPPFTAPDVGELLRAHITQIPRDPRSLRPELSPMFSAIIQRLLAKDPDDRYQRGDGLLADLRRLAANPDGEEFPLGTQDRPVAQGAEPPFVGRRDELSRLRAVWTDTRRGQGGLVLVRGSAGIGKTRLVSEFTLGISGHRVLHGWHWSPDPAPLAALRGAVGDHIDWLLRSPEPIRSASLSRIATAAAPVASLILAAFPALASVVPHPDGAGVESGESRGDQMITAIVEFLRSLAALERGLVLHLDDGHRLGPATLAVLRRLAHETRDSHLMIVVTARDDLPCQDGFAGLFAAIGAALACEIMLDRLDPQEMRQLVAAALPGVGPDGIRLAARSDGNPFTLVEYVRLVLELGLLRPSWGTWHLDVADLDGIDLPSDALDLVRRRLDSLSEASRAVLRTAAVLRDRFTPGLLASVHGSSIESVTGVVQEAITRGLMEAEGPRHYGFLHETIAEVLVTELSAADRRRLHQRAAEAMEADPNDDDFTSGYAKAHHYLKGEIASTPQRLVAACLAAGEHALTSNAPEAALKFYEQAQAAATATGTEVCQAFHIHLGEAQYAAGRFEAARVTLQQALAVEADPLRRARAAAQLARVHIGLLRFDAAIEIARAALVELGERLPRTKLGLALSGISRYIIARCSPRMARKPMPSEQRPLALLVIQLHDLVSQAELIMTLFADAASMSMRTLPLVSRLGAGMEYSRAYAATGFCLRVLGARREAKWLFRRANWAAAEVADPRPAADTAMLDALSGFVSGLENANRLRRCVDTQGRWLEINFLHEALKVLCRYEAFRGNTSAGIDRYEQAVGELSGQPPASWVSTAAILNAVRGRPSDVARNLAAFPKETAQLDPPLRLDLAIARLLVALEQQDFGAAFQNSAREVLALPLDPKVFPTRFRTTLVRQLTCRPDRPGLALVAMGRLAQVEQRLELSPGERVSAATPAVRLLGEYANSPLLRAYHMIAAARLRYLAGDHKGAFRRLSQGEPLLYRANAPVTEFEVARLKAQILAARGNSRASLSQARFALMLAAANDWAFRRRWISAAFHASDLTQTERQRRAIGTATPDSSSAGRRLAALEQVSLAAFRVLDPDELVRVVLDETIRILAADRALLFLSTDDQLQPHLGRNAAGEDISVFEGFSASLVRRVRETGEVLVVTGSEQGIALGSESMVAHGLRSIMVAPLRLEGRFLGAVYLDSRVAKGVFTSDDAGLLLAIVNHIAVSLETARVVQLETTVRAERERRDVAERLQRAMAAVTASLDQSDVLYRMLEQLVRILPGERGWLLQKESSGFRIIASFPRTGDPPGDVQVVPADRRLDETLGSGQPMLRTGDEPAPGGLTAPGRSWIALPCGTRSAEPMIALISVPESDSSRQPQLQVAMVLVRHGITAYDHARLFAQVRQLATTDELTGVANRRDLFAKAALAIATAKEQHRPLTAIMIDIDHFKAVNDTYGHQVGDEVIRAVAERIRQNLRSGDLVGRYGGEEFAVILPNSGSRDLTIAARIHEHFRAAPIDTLAGPVQVAISVGATELAPDDNGVEAVFARADRALYRAKRAGRNRVVALQP